MCSAPVVRGAAVYLSCGERTHVWRNQRPESRSVASVVALHASDGSLLWRSQLGGETESQMPTALATLDDQLFVGYAGTVYALDLADGAIRWRFQTNGVQLSSPAVSPGMVYDGASDGYAYALAAQDGSLRWKAFTSASITIASGVVLKSFSVGAPQPPAEPPGDA